MRDAQGRRVRLSDFRGRVVVVDLWASWSTSCEVSFPVLEALAREFGQRGVDVIAVNLDEQRKNADAFLRGRSHQLLVTFDPRARVLKAFGAAGIPTSFVIDRQGTIRYTLSGHTSAFESELRRHITAVLSDVAP
jgi:thiol-disulfide isomerase/thioredoxin